jgi:transposase
MAYSKDFRKKVQSIRDERGLSLLAAAALFGVGASSVQRWLEKPEACKTRNKPATKIDMEALARDVEERPDDFQYERAARLGVSESCVGKALKRLGLSRKKKLDPPKSLRKTKEPAPREN